MKTGFIEHNGNCNSGYGMDMELLVWANSRDSCPELTDGSVFGQIQLADAYVSDYIVHTAVAIYCCCSFCV